MSADCCHSGCSVSPSQDPRYRKVLWIALWVNALMFVVEIVAGAKADSASLIADAIDFAGDAANYGISLFVLSMALTWRARAALIKGASMGLYGAFVIGLATYNAYTATHPQPITMGVVGTLALLANVGAALLLYRFRSGDANMRSVWLCTRNDAIGNIAILFAALGVFGTGSGWPDFIVALVMGSLALMSAISVVRQARAELGAEAVKIQAHA